jgi:hypothetical protein
MPHAIASSATRPKVSLVDGKTSASAEANAATSSSPSRNPVKTVGVPA